MNHEISYLILLVCANFLCAQEFVVKPNYTRLCALIAHNPQKVLDENTQRWKELRHSTMYLSTSEFIQKCPQLLREKPISWLTECCDSACTLNRFFEVSRMAYESVVLSFLKEQYTNDKKYISFISVGSGGMFQDLVTVTQFLLWHKEYVVDRKYYIDDIVTLPDMLKLDIHLIDTSYALQQTFMQVAQTARQKEGRSILDCSSKADSRDFLLYVNKVAEPYRHQKDFAARQRAFYMEVAQPFYAQQQFAHLLKTHFVDVDVEVIMHPDTDAFLQIYDNHIPHVVVASDLQKECHVACNQIDTLQAPLAEYIMFVKQLCSRAHARSYPVKNVCLSKLNASFMHDGKPHLLTVKSDNNCQDCQEYRYKDTNNNDQVAYIHDTIALAKV